MIRLGVTQSALARRFGLSQSHMNKIISGERELGGIGIQSIASAFPGYLLVADHNHIPNNGTINGNVSQTSGSVDDFKLRLMKGLLDLKIPGDALAQVLKFVNDAQ